MKTLPTLTSVLEARASATRKIHYLAGDGHRRAVSFEALHDTALGVLRHFQEFGIAPGHELIIFTPSNEQFVDGFWACLLGGIVPVPVAVGISDDHRQKLLKIFAQLREPWVYTDRGQLNRLRDFAVEAGRVAEFQALKARALCVEDIKRIGPPGKPRAARAEDIAFIQFSSGSTGDPKGVVLTHSNIMANIRGIIEAARFTEDDVSLSWMPLTHDMGLIGFHLCMLAAGIEHTIMDTQLFSRRPLLWLKEASDRGATLLSSPNFGYKHFLKVLDSRGLEGIDLSRVRLIFNGAEPISAALCDRFLRATARFGLRREAMYPVYGLAEASLAVTFPEPGRACRSIRVDRRRLAGGTVCRSEDSRDGLELVRLGTPVAGCELRITDDSGRPLGENHVGHIQIRGDNVTRGYYGGHDGDVFTADGWLRTGDLGFRVDGELVVTGRFKELIIRNGENIHPHDLEAIAETVTGLELGKVAIAGARRVDAEEDELLVFLVHRGSPEDFIPLARRVRRRIAEYTALDIQRVIPVRSIPKTTSGKVQRGQLARRFEDGEFDAVLAEIDALEIGAERLAGGGPSHIQQALMKLCAAVVDDRRVGVDDDFFSLGISSMALARLFERIDEQYPGLLEMQDLFDKSSIRDIAAYIELQLAARTG